MTIHVLRTGLVRLWPIWLFFSGMLPAQEDAPLIYKVELEFAGNETLPTVELHRALSALRVDLSRHGVDEAGVDDASYELLRYYRAKGFPEVTLQDRWEREGDAHTIYFVVDEGPRSFLSSLTFEDNLQLEESALRACFAWIRAGILGIEPLGLGKLVFTEDVLSSGIHCLVRKHQHEGYFFATATAETQSTDKGVEVKVVIEEGPLIEVVAPPGFAGNEAHSAETLRELLDLDTGVVYTPRLPIVLKGKLVDFYKRRGYFFVQIDTKRNIDREAGTAILDFVIREGPLTFIDDIELSGNKTTRDWVIWQRVRLQAGDLYNEERVRETHRSLLLSGLFSSVDIETERIDDRDDRLVMSIEVTEKKRYRASLLAGYGSYEMLRGKMTIENINFMGFGNRLRLEGRASFRGEAVKLEHLIPYFFMEKLSQQTALEYEQREHPSFDRTEFGGRAGVGYRFSRHVRTNLVYRARESASADVDAGVPSELINDVFLSSLEWSTVLEYRDSVLRPEKGSTHRFTLEYASPALGSDLHYIRYVLLTTWVFPLWLDMELVASSRFGVIHTFGSTTEVPIQERFFLGGHNTIRSFEQDEAGPESGGDVIGGEAFLLYNLELRFPIFRDLQGAIFGDAGTVNEVFEDFGGNRYFFAVGTGLRYLTPIGPFRADFAVNPHRREDEDEFLFHFSLGYPF